jgi:hypothetical protein
MEFEELAAIAEYEGRLPRPHAEVLAALMSLNSGSEAEKYVDLIAHQLEFLANIGALK